MLHVFLCLGAALKIDFLTVSPLTTSAPNFIKYKIFIKLLAFENYLELVDALWTANWVLKDQFAVQRASTNSK